MSWVMRSRLRLRRAATSEGLLDLPPQEGLEAGEVLDDDDPEAVIEREHRGIEHALGMGRQSEGEAQAGAEQRRGGAADEGDGPGQHGEPLTSASIDAVDAAHARAA